MDAPNDRYINDEQIAQAIAADLAKVKITVKVNAMPKSSYFPKVNSADASFNLLGWSNSDGDASSFLDACVHTFDQDKGYGRYNGGRYSNAEVDRLIEESDVMIDQVERLKLMKKAQKIALEDDQGISHCTIRSTCMPIMTKSFSNRGSTVISMFSRWVKSNFAVHRREDVCLRGGFNS